MKIDVQIIKVVGQIAGIGGISLGIFLLLFKEIIKKNIFPKFKNEKLSYNLLRLIIISVWSIAVVGIGSWVYSSNKLVPMQENRSNGQNNPDNSATSKLKTFPITIKAPENAIISVDDNVIGSGVATIDLTEGTYIFSVKNDTSIWEYPKQINHEKVFIVTPHDMKPINSKSYTPDIARSPDRKIGKTLQVVTGKGSANISYQCDHETEKPCPPYEELKRRAIEVAKVYAMEDISKKLNTDLNSLNITDKGRLKTEKVILKSGAILNNIEIASPIVNGDHITIHIKMELKITND
ncbi:MAG: hypothetical protein GY795_28235 [Desulfobacterales bacterium]|nr:hypothetical protein [Desulfobacterales bacterium]